MKYLKHGVFLLIALISAMCSCGPKDNPTPTPDPTPKAPTAITLSVSSLQATAIEESFEITVKSPFVPNVDKPGWIEVSFGTLKDYTVTMTVMVRANTDQEERSATLTLTATGATSATLSISQAAAETPGENKGLASFFGLGWNLGNHFDAYYNGSWAGEKEGYPAEDAWDGSFATQATFDGVKNAGFTSVRIPVTWIKMIGDAPDYTINEAWINRVYEVVQFAHNAGLKVIINTHHDENHGVDNTYQWLDIKNASNNAELNAQIKAKIRGTWTNIANKFKDCGDDWLMMEGFNELNDGGWGWSADFQADPTKQTRILDEWNQVFVNAVRATGGYNATRWLGVPSYCANPEFTKYMVLPDDPAGKLAVSVHFYDPSDYTIGKAQYSDWGHTGAAGKKADGGDEDHVKSVFGKLYSTYVAKGVPVYVGEFGCSMRSKSDTRAWAFYKYYLEYVVKAAKTYSLPCFLWDNGTDGIGQEQHGYIHHGTGNYIGSSKEVVDVMKQAWFTESEGYTLETVYNGAPKY